MGIVEHWLRNVVNGLADWVTKEFKYDPAEIFNVMKDIRTNTQTLMDDILTSNLIGIMKTVALCLVVVFFLMDLITKSTAVHKMTFESVIVSLLKIVIAKMVVENSMEILKIFDSIAYAVSEIAYSPALGTGGATTPSFSEELQGTNIANIAAYVISSVIGSIILIVGFVGIRIVLWGRQVEIFLMMVLSPVAIAGLASDSMKGTAKKFFLNFAAICLQMLVIVVIAWVMKELTAVFRNKPAQTFSDSIVQGIVMPMFLVQYMKKSREIASNIIGA